MSGFIFRAACKGRRPAQFAGFDGRERPALLARLLQDRNVARFIVAPPGYGKTSLAIQYAETMTSWVHTFWVNAQSPCFIRDLDNDDIVDAIASADSQVKLVVFDALPVLGLERATSFSSVVDRLLARSCEVVVTCGPESDSLASLQRDRVLLNAYDLLLDDAELDAVRASDERSRKPSSQLSAIWRIPLLAWGPEEERESESSVRTRFARMALCDGLSSELLLIMGNALVLRHGTRLQLKSFASLSDSQFAELVEDYPHICLDESSERFEAPSIELDHLAPALKRALVRMARCSTFDTGEQLVRAWADLLMTTGQPGRACDLMRTVYPHQRSVEWLADNSWELVRRACFLPAMRLASEDVRPKGTSRFKLHALEAVCRRMLGDDVGAKRCAKRCAFDGDAPSAARVCALIVLAETGEEAITGQVDAALEAAALHAGGGAPAGKASLARGERAFGENAISEGDWALIADAKRASRRGVQELAQWWLDHVQANVGPDALCIVAAWLFDLADRVGEYEDYNEIAALRSCESFVRGLLADANRQELDFFTASAALAMEEARVRGVQYEAGPLGAATLVRLRNFELDMLSQRRRFDEERLSEKRARQDWANTHPDALLVHDPVFWDRQEARSTPILNLRLFGSFDASIGGVPIGQEKFNRKNTRTLLAVLAVNGGREVARDVILNALWPGRSAESGRKNLYTVWSNLRKALSLPDGTCPYLIRHQYGCSLDSHFVHSDAERLDEICRELLFGVPNVEQWSLLFAELDRDFSYDLMPSERKNPLINQARIDYRNQLVDALTGATTNLIDAGTPQWGIWFSRMAVKRDELREDAYIALMRAQIACNQRTAAMMTYLKCREVLAARLGIDPSAEAQALYKSLLDSE